MKRVLRPRTPSRIVQDVRPPLAVVIGIARHAQSRLTLQTPVNDARTLATVLSRWHGYEVWLRTDEDASLAALRSLLTEELPEAVSSERKDEAKQEGRRVLFYFAGHGISAQGLEGPDGHLVPYDADDTLDSLLPMAELNTELQALPCRHLLLILDCCFAGAFRWSGRREAVFTAPALYEERYQLYLRTSAWQFIASAAYDERAMDVLAERTLGARGPLKGTAARHSPFCFALLRGLLGNADIFPPALQEKQAKGDGVITATELYLYLRNELSDGNTTAGPTQTPGLWLLPRHHSGEYVFRTPWDTRPLKKAPELSLENNPYRGLEPFSHQHADLFFGRRDVVERLRSQVERHPLTVVLAPSGAGKTSLVQAGLRPELSKWHADWAQYSLRPGGTPLQELAKVLALLIGPEASAASRPLADQVRDLPPGPPVVLIVDQLEELITLRPGEAAREAFLATLAAAVASNRIHIVCTLRSDYESSFVRGALTGWEQARFHFEPMGPRALQLVIEGPAEARALVFEPPDLPSRLAHELAAMPGALPLLSFTLSQLYLKYLERGATDRRLTQKDYEELEGVHGALWKRARDVFEALDAPTQETMRHLLLRMVALEGERARRKVPRDELVFRDEALNQRVEQVLQVLSSADARLVVPDTNAQGIGHVEPAHDALVRGWSYLDIWLEEEKETLPLQRQLTEAAREWEARGRDQGLWHDDPRLPYTLDLEPWLNITEREFVEASQGERRRQRAVRNRFLAAIALTVLSVLGVTVSRNSELAQRVAASTAVSAASAKAEGDVVLALLLTSEAVKQLPADDPMRPSYVAKLIQLATRAPEQVGNARFEAERAFFSPDLDFALMLSPGDHAVAVWDAKARDRRQTPIQTLGQGLHAHPAFSRDGMSIAAVASTDMEQEPLVLHAWDTRSGTPWFARELRRPRVGPRPKLGMYEGRSPLTFSGNGAVLMMRSYGALTSWGTDGGVLFESEGPGVDEIALMDTDCSNGGAGAVPRTRYTIDGGVPEAWVELQDVTTGQMSPLLPGQAHQRVEQVTPLGGSGRVALVTRAVVPTTAACAYERQRDLAYHPAPGCVDPPVPLPRPAGRAGIDGGVEISRLQVWQGPPWFPAPGFRPYDLPERFHIVDVSEDGTWVLTTSESNVNHEAHGVRVWRVEDGAYFMLSLPLDEAWASLRLSEDGRRLITTSRQRSVQVYDVETGVRLGGPLRLPFRAAGTSVSREGSHLAAVSNEGMVLEWKIPLSRPIQTGRLPMPESREWIAISPLMEQVVSCSNVRTQGCDTPQLLDVQTGEVRWSPRSPASGAYSRLFAFSSDGSRIASVLLPDASARSSDVEVWRINDGARQSGPLHLEGLVVALGFLPKGDRLTTVTQPSLETKQGDILQTWKPDTAAVVCQQELPRDWQPLGLTRSARHLVVEDVRRARVQLWNTDTCEPLKLIIPVGGDTTELGSLARRALLESTDVLRESCAELRLSFAGGGTWILRTGEKTVQLMDGATGQPVLPPTAPPEGTRHVVHVGPGGRWVVSSTVINRMVAGENQLIGEWLQAWDSWTGRALTPDIWSRQGSLFTTIHALDGTLTTLAADGTIQRWFVAAPVRDENWLRGLASAITGMALDVYRLPQPLPPEKHRALVESVRKQLLEAARNGDANARALVPVLVEDGPLRP